MTPVIPSAIKARTSLPQIGRQFVTLNSTIIPSIILFLVCVFVVDEHRNVYYVLSRPLQEVLASQCSVRVCAQLRLPRADGFLFAIHGPDVVCADLLHKPRIRIKLSAWMRFVLHLVVPIPAVLSHFTVLVQEVYFFTVCES